MIDYRRYYDLETYLLEVVSPRFHQQGFIEAFDFFSIVIWKANRAKSRIAKKLLQAGAPEKSLDIVCRRLTCAVHDASSDEERFLLLFNTPWNFALPMASAILTVLYPDTFTVYDYRVCDELADPEFQKLVNYSNPHRIWEGYSRFLVAVESSSSTPGLRNKDRFLIGRSLATQLKRDIKSLFNVEEDSSSSEPTQEDCRGVMS